MPKTLELHVPEGEETIEADVCIVGSGAGGSVIAATLAERGMDVVVLDAAGYFNESDFAQLEFKAYQEMYWRGGPNPDGGRQRQPGQRHDAGRRHHDQLDQLPADQALGPRAVGDASTGSTASTAPTSTPTSTRSGSGSASPTPAAT